MQTSLVVTIVAPDRPGLVNAVSDKATEFGANWADSVMAQMAGQFAGILHLQVPSQNADALVAALKNLDADNMRVLVAKGAAMPGVGRRQVTLDLVGQDRPGIIRSISAELARQGVSIDKLQTQLESGAMSGESLFKMHARLSIPAAVSDDDLRAGLESLANELMVDISLD